MNFKQILSITAIALFPFIGFSQGGWCGTPSPYTHGEIQHKTDHKPSSGINNTNAKMATKYIPVVVHVLHDNGIGNISYDQIKSALDSLTVDFQRMNADTSDTRSTVDAPFKQVAGGMDVEFKLAKIDPNGNCTNGIIRKNVGNSDATYNVPANYPSLEPHKQTSAGGSDAWPRNKYFNIWVVNSIGSGPGIIFGYAQFPETNNFNDTYGITIRHDEFGTGGTASNVGTRTLTHEVGHCFDLIHTFQPSVFTGVDGCNNGDEVADTPPSDDQTGFTCNYSQNTCPQISGPYTTDVLDQIENYMSYSLCQNMFSQGQVDRMTDAFNSNGYLSSLWSSGNATNTGVNLPDAMCKAEFEASKTVICVGDQIQFSDFSYNLVNGWDWTFTGGTPSTSTAQNPVITYNTPGIYAVTLEATDGSTNNTETKTEYIKVLPAGASVPFNEGFEAYTTLQNQLEWEVYNPAGNAEWDITTSASHSGARCAKLPNYGQGAGNIDELTSAPVDLSSITGATNMTLTFRYAYRKRFAGNDAYLKVQVTNDCGDTWVTRKTMHGDVISDLIETSSWTPADFNDWTTVHMTNVTSAYWVDNFRYKFRFESDGGNNLYLDNINLYPGAPSYDVVVGLEEGKELDGLSVYPNPTDDELNIRFSIGASQQVTFAIQDVMGKTVQTNLINANAGSNYVMMDVDTLASGMYFLNIITGGAQQTVQFVVK